MSRRARRVRRLSAADARLAYRALHHALLDAGVQLAVGRLANEDGAVLLRHLRALRDWLAQTSTRDGLTAEADAAYEARAVLGFRVVVQQNGSVVIRVPAEARRRRAR